MRSRVIRKPNGATFYVTADGDVVDDIAHFHYGQHAKNTEMLLEANPHVVGVGAILTAGIHILLPDVPKQEPPKAFRRLWD